MANRLTGWAWKDRLDMPYFAWDAYFLYDGNADWNTQLPEPAFWMHQGVGIGKAPYLDATEFELKVRELLAENLAK